MRITIPRIVQAIELREYAAEFGDEKIYVWVNPPREMMERLGETQNEDDLRGWLVEIWGQGPEETHWSREEIDDLVESCEKTDPGLVAWLLKRTLELIREHRSALQKK